MAHRSEQGNILGFVLVGAALVALLLGGIYIVRHTVANQNGDPAVVTTDDSQNSSNESSDGSNGSSNDGVQQGDASKDTDTTNSSDDSLKKALDNQSSSNGNSKEAESSADGDAEDGSEDADTSSAANLPKTGPEDTVLTVLGATLVIGVGVAYLRSRSLL